MPSGIKGFAVATAFLAAAFVTAGGMTLSSPAIAEELHAHDATNIWSIARGGKLYDNWASVLEHDSPKETHPAWPASNTKKKGGTTWRCKSCHGWDYLGKDGAYGSGSYKTGIKGVRAYAGADPNKIHQILQDKTHGYTDKHMPHSAMEKISLFVSQGQVDNDRYIDRKSKVARGNPRSGAGLYQTICAGCHGFDGKELNFGDEKKPEYVGTVCVKNPWEALHKIRFGQPGVPMVSLASLDIEKVVDILAFCQILPTK